jgi:hypothetical protein
MPHEPVAWWTAFGAIAQAAGAIATFGAVVISLWVVLSERAMRARGYANIMITFIGDGTPGTYLVGIQVLNAGVRPFQVTSVGWRTGWLRRGPKALQFRYAIQNTSIMLNQRPGPHIVDPGREEGFYTPVADMKRSNNDESRTELFGRKLPILGEAPVRGIVNISGRKPLYVKVSKDLAHFLRTGDHASTTADEAE